MIEIIKLFLKIGTLGFGGPIATLGFIEEECVQRKKWLSEETFQRIVGVSKLFPGPLSSMVAVRIGTERNGILGGIAAGISIILPAFIMIIGLAKIAHSLDLYPVLNPLWLGLSLAALAVAFHATTHLMKPLFKNKSLQDSQIISILIISAILVYFFPRYEFMILLSFGFFGLAAHQIKSGNRPLEIGSLGLLTILFTSCLKASLFTFGTGIAIIPVLQNVFIDEHHWVSNSDFLRGLTLAQITPGPLIILSTYLGFVTQGWIGAIVTTVGTFLPAFVFGSYVLPKVESKILKSEPLRIFFSWLMPSVCGAIFGSLIRLMLYTVQNDGHVAVARIFVIIVLFAIQLKLRLSPPKIFLLGGGLAYLIR